MPRVLACALVLLGVLTRIGATPAQPPGQHLGDAAASRTELLRHFQRSIVDYSLTTFGAREGAPAEVMAITQTPDGFLWLASQEGLFRFDGVHFTHQDSVKGSVRTVTSDSQGGIWVGYRFGGAGRLFEGRYEDHSAGLPPHSVYILLVDAQGVVWAESTTGPYKFSDGKWTAVGAADGIPGNPGQGQMGKLADGSIWMLSRAAPNQVWVKAVSSHTFQAMDRDRFWRSLFGATPSQMPPANATALQQSLESPQTWFVSDPTGALWTVTPNLNRMRWMVDAGQKRVIVENLPQVGGGMNEAFTTIATDREGNVWVGSTNGLTRISANKLIAVAPPNKMIMPFLAKGPHGDVWIAANEGQGIYHATGGAITAWRSQTENIAALYEDKSERLWIFNFSPVQAPATQYIERLNPGGRVERVGYPAGLSHPPLAFAERADGGYLMSTSTGLYHYDGQWEPATGLPPLGALTVTVDSMGATWLSYPNGEVLAFEKNGRQTLYSAKEVALGAVYAVDPKPGRTWMAGDSGVALESGGHVTSLWRGDENPFFDAHGVVETKAGELWISADSGVYRISPAGLTRALGGSPPRPDEMEVFNRDDGLMGATSNGFQLGLVEDGDGKIWISRNDGASWIDPRAILRNPVPAQATLGTVELDGHAMPAGAQIDIPPRTHSLRVNFTAASLTHPDRVTFRYRLEGVDKDWQAATTRRFADYSDPPPGPHVFQVEGFNEDGASTGTPAVMKLTVEPTIYQTWWFWVLCVLAFVILLILVFRARMRRSEEKLGLVLEARHKERDRIARELHDTLMQSMQGLTLQIHAWSEDPGTEPDKRKREMRWAAEMATHSLKEGREKILELRQAAVSDPGLLTELRKTAEHFALRYPLVFDLRETGVPAELKPVAFQEMLDVAREAIRNAAIHANASKISIFIDYGKRALTLTVSDDGDGFPTHVLEAGLSPGHWGLVGMKERARALGAQFSFENRPDGGAEIRLIVPALLAYKKMSSRGWWRAKRVVDAQA